MKRKIAVEVRAGRAASVSAYFTDALERMGRHEQLAEVLAEVLEQMDKELGQPSARDGALARRVLGL